MAVVLYVLVCLLLLVVVLLQQGKGGDIAAAFGGSSSQTAFGARAGATVLTRATAVLGTLFMVGAFVLGRHEQGRRQLGGQRHGRASAVGNVGACAPDVAAAAYANEHGHAGTDRHSGTRGHSRDDAGSDDDAQPGARQRQLVKVSPVGRTNSAEPLTSSL